MQSATPNLQGTRHRKQNVRLSTGNEREFPQRSVGRCYPSSEACIAKHTFGASCKVELVKTKLSHETFFKNCNLNLWKKLSCKVSLCCETSLLWDLCCETSFLRILFCEFLFAMIFFCCETSLLRFFALRFVRCDFFKCETPCHRSITRFLNFLWSCEHIGRQSCRPHSAYPRNNGANLNTKAATCTTPSPHSCLCASWPH